MAARRSTKRRAQKTTGRAKRPARGVSAARKPIKPQRLAVNRKESTRGVETHSQYVMKVPKKYRDLPAKELVSKIVAQIERRHGKGKRDYSIQHFYFTFTGTEYNPYNKRRAGRGTYGSSSKASLRAAVEEFVSRLKEIKGENPEGIKATAAGDPSNPVVRGSWSTAPGSMKTIRGKGYGVFRNGPLQIVGHVMERPPKQKRRKRRK